MERKISANRLSAIIALGALSAVAIAALFLPARAARAADARSAPVAQAADGEDQRATPTKKPAPGPGAVSVHVFFLAENMPQNPDETIEANGKRYIYFNSPQLAAPARPLSEPKPRYPKGKFAQKNGAVLLQLLIDEQGGLARSDVVCAAPPFMKSALESVQGLKFQPAVAREGPVKSYMLVEFGYGKGHPCGRISD